MQYCDVLIEESFLHNQKLTYSCQGFEVSLGTRIWVNVRNRRMVGFVVAVYEADPMDFDFDIKPVQAVIDAAPILNDELFQLAEKMSYQTVSPLIRCLQAILPNKLRPKKTTTKPKTIKGLRFVGDQDFVLTSKQKEFVEAFKMHDFVSIKEAQAVYSGFRKLIELGVFESVLKEVRYEPEIIEKSYLEHKLSVDQQAVFDAVKLDESHTYLIHGVTGSGKTEVYLQLADRVLKKKESVLFLVPEISLTPQMIARVSKRFGKDVAIYHSSLNDQEKYEQYLRVKNNEVQIVVGTRSAVFMPFDKLGLIIIDEEHDTSYKQNITPMYHTLDVATERSKTHACPLILGSASPRLETYARALKGVYTLLKMPQRINHSFPKVTLIDTKDALYQKQSSILTDTLIEGIQKRLDKNEQVILVLNRRGYMTLLKDKQTQAVLMCPNCDISLNYHKYDNTLKCHQCDYHTHHIPKGVDGQVLEVVGSGVGTQRLEERLRERFPKSRIARMDRDTTTQKNAHETILSAFRKHEFDILVGTQMIAKGLDIANVTLVGILNIDTALTHEDFRSVEETFHLILQASGRSGRGDKVGEVMIQSFNTDHYAVQYAVHNRYEAFFKQEMSYRKLAQYPPYSYLISIVFSDEKESNAYQKALDFYKMLKTEDIKILGPSILLRLKGMHRVRIILKSKDLNAMLNKVHEAYDKIDKGGIRIDVNPISLM